MTGTLTPEERVAAVAAQYDEELVGSSLRAVRSTAPRVATPVAAVAPARSRYDVDEYDDLADFARSGARPSAHSAMTRLGSAIERASIRASKREREQAVAEDEG